MQHLTKNKKSEMATLAVVMASVVVGLLGVAMLTNLGNVLTGYATISGIDICGYYANEDVLLSGDSTNCANGITVNATDIVIDCNGHTIMGQGVGTQGIIVGNKSGVTIKDCEITNFTVGINSQAENTNITGNTFSGYTRDAIALIDAQNANIEFNTFNPNVSYGVYMEEGGNHEIIYNEFDIICYGILGDKTNNNIIKENSITGIPNGSYGCPAPEGRISGWHNSGIKLGRSDNNQLIKNVISNTGNVGHSPGGRGIFISSGSQSNLIENNTCYNNTEALIIGHDAQITWPNKYSDNNIVRNNEFQSSRSTSSIILTGAQYNLITGNQIIDSLGDGIKIHIGNDNKKTSYNNITNNLLTYDTSGSGANGIAIRNELIDHAEEEITGNIIDNNTILYYNWKGISIEYADSTTISNNKINVSGSDYNLVMTSQENVTNTDVFGNSFYNQGVNDEGTSTTFCVNSIGNKYYSISDYDEFGADECVPETAPALHIPDYIQTSSTLTVAGYTNKSGINATVVGVQGTPYQSETELGSAQSDLIETCTVTGSCSGTSCKVGCSQASVGNGLRLAGHVKETGKDYLIDAVAPQDQGAWLTLSDDIDGSPLIGETAYIYENEEPTGWFDLDITLQPGVNVITASGHNQIGESGNQSNYTVLYEVATDVSGANVCGYLANSSIRLTSSTPSECAAHGIIANKDNIIIDCNNKIINGSGNYNGIHIGAHNGVTVKNCIIRNFTKGIYSVGSNNTMKYNNIQTNEYGIEHQTSSNSIISYNTIDTLHYGIYGEDIYNSTILENTITGINGSLNLAGGEEWFLAGIRLLNAKNTTVVGNNVQNTIGSGGGRAIFLARSSKYNIIENNTGYNISSGILIGHGSEIGNYTSHNIIRNNIFEKTRAYGLRIRGATHNLITGNQIIEGENVGIRLDISSNDLQASYNNITNNVVTHGTAVSISGMELVKDPAHELSNPLLAGITGNIIDNNSLYNHTSWGIKLSEYADANIISNNLIDNDGSLSSIGLYAGADNNQIYGNHFYDKGVNDQGTNNNYCVNNISNKYFNSVPHNEFGLNECVPDYPTVYSIAYTSDPTIYLYGYTNSSGINVTAQAIQVGPYNISKTPVGDQGDLIETCKVREDACQSELEYSACEVDCENLAEDYAIGFTSHERTTLLYYPINNIEDGGDGKMWVNLTGALEGTVAVNETIGVYSQKEPTGWFNISIYLENGESIIEAFPKNRAGEKGYESQFVVDYPPEGYTGYGNCNYEANSSITLTADMGPCVEHGIIINSDSITIDCNNKRIRGDNETTQSWNESGIFFNSNYNNVQIKNCIIDGFRQGILAQGNSLTLTNNQINAVQDGEDNTGIYVLGNGQNSLVTSNNIETNYLGIYAENQDNILVKLNTISANYSGIDITNSFNSILSYNDITDVSGGVWSQAGISMENTNTTNVDHNTISNTGDSSLVGGHCIKLSSISYSNIIEENDCLNNTVGVWVGKDSAYREGIYSTAKLNTISNNQIDIPKVLGIYLLGVENNTIANNTINSTNITAIKIETDSTHLKGRYNEIDNNTITFSSIIGTFHGIQITGGTNPEESITGNQITENTITDSSDASIKIEKGISNIIRDNILNGRNLNLSIYLGTLTSTNQLYGNDFYDAGVSDSGTNNNYCVASVGNNYYNDVSHSEFGRNECAPDYPNVSVLDYMQTNENISVYGFTDKSGINVTVQAKQGPPYSTVTKTVSSHSGLIATCQIASGDCEYGSDYSNCEVDCKDADVGNNVILPSYLRSDRKAYAINAITPTDDYKEWLNFTPALEQPISVGDTIQIYTEELPTGWFNVSLTLRPGISTIASFAHNKAGEDGYATEFDVSYLTDIEQVGANEACGYEANESIVLTDDSKGCAADGIIINTDNMSVDCNNYLIKGSNTGIGIDLNDFDNITISNCNISNFTTGIYGEGDSLTLTGNTIRVNMTGISLLNSKNNLISNNEISNITASGGPDGIILSRTNYTTIQNNNITNIGKSSWNGTGIVVTTKSLYNTIENNKITNTGGAILVQLGSNQNTIKENQLHYNRNSGITLNGVENCLVTENTYPNASSDGLIFRLAANYPTLENNNITNNNFTYTTEPQSYMGMALFIPSDVPLSQASITNNIIDNNTITNSGGIAIDLTAGNKINSISNNIIRNNHLDAAGNTISIELEDNSNNNQIYNNKFYDAGVEDTGTNNYCIGGVGNKYYDNLTRNVPETEFGGNECIIDQPTYETIAYNQTNSNIGIFGVLDKSGINITAQATQTWPYTINSTPVSGDNKLIETCNIFSTNCVSETNYTVCEVTCEYPEIGNYIKFSGHDRTNLQYYEITNKAFSGPDKIILNITPKLEDTITASETIYLYELQKPAGWYNLSITLNPGESTINYIQTPNYNQPSSTMILYGYTEKTGMIITAQAKQGPPYQTNTQGVSGYSDLRASSYVDDEGCVGENNNAYCEIISTDGDVGDYTEFPTKKRRDFLRYEVVSEDESNPGEWLNITPALEQSMDILDQVDFYSTNQPTGWFNISLNLRDGLSTVTVYIRNTDGEQSIQETFIVNHTPGVFNNGLIASEFHDQGDLTTDFLLESDYSNVSNLKLGVLDKGQIIWHNNVNINNTNLDNAIEISHNSIDVEPLLLHPSLNSSATITIFNLSFEKVPIILKDGDLCDNDCTGIIYDGENLTFNVSHFTIFSAATNSNITIYDDNDEEGGSQNKTAGDQIYFYTEYIKKSNNNPITPAEGGECSINFTVYGPDGQMQYDAQTQKYKFDRNFTINGLVNYTITCNSTSYEIVDATDEINITGGIALFNVYDGYIDASSQKRISDITTRNNLYANWTNITDADAINYQYAIGTGSTYLSYGWNDTKQWTNVTDREVNLTLVLTPGTVYYFHVRAYTTLEEYTPVASSNGIYFEDQSTPSCINDGYCVFDDGAYTGNITLLNGELHAWWNFTENNSVIAEYEYAIGNVDPPTQGQPPTISFDNIKERTKTIFNDVTDSGLTLANNISYYYSVRARNNNVGNQSWSNWYYSDGIKVDTIQPYGGSLSYPHGIFTLDQIPLEVDIGNDSISGIDDANEVRIYYSEGNLVQDNLTCDGFTPYMPWLRQRPYPDTAWFNVTEGTCYMFKMMVTDRAGNSVTYYSQNATGAGIVLTDMTAPSTPSVYDEGFVTYDDTELYASWSESSDPETAVLEYQYSVWTSCIANTCDDQITSWTTVSYTQADAHITNLSLVDEYTYYIKVRAKNLAEIYSTPGVSDGIIYIDNQPPQTSIIGVENDNSTPYVDNISNSQTTIIVRGEQQMSCVYLPTNTGYQETGSNLCTQTGNLANCVITPEQQGTSTKYIFCRDKNGNEQQTGSRVDWFTDTQAPNVTIESPELDERVGANISMSFTVTDMSDLSLIYYNITNTSNQIVAGTDVNGSLTNPSTGTYGITWDSFEYKDASYQPENITLNIVATDIRGYKRRAGRRFTLDNTLPAIDISSPDKEFVNTNFTLDISIQLFKNAGYTIANGSNATDSSTWLVQKTNYSNESVRSITWQDYINITNWGEGNYSVWVEATNKNRPETADKYSWFYIDRTRPIYSSITKSPVPAYNDDNITLSVQFNDSFMEKVVITHNASGLFENVTATKSGNTYSIQIMGNNTAKITWLANGTDKAGNWNSTEWQNFTIYNRAPVTNRTEVSFSEDSGLVHFELEQDGFFYDPDHDDLTFTSGNGVNITVLSLNPATGETIVTSNSNFFGWEVIQFNATDGLITATNNINITVTPVQDAPEFNGPIPAIVWNQTVGSGTVNLTQYFSDVDGDSLTYSANTSECPNISVQNLGTPTGVVLTNNAGFYGSQNITFSASDGSNTTTSNVVMMTVLPDPEIVITGVSAEPYLIAENETVLLSVELFSYYDHDINATVTRPGSGTYEIFDDNFTETETSDNVFTHTFNITDTEDIGVHDIHIRVNDTDGNDVFSQANFTVEAGFVMQIIFGP
ncbi:right-handed parallel beta-helix repeat-containing protein [Nanoarchaeota archaeon]